MLISGGNLGVGGLEQLIADVKDSPLSKDIHYYILCGKNQLLYEHLKKMADHLIPLPYIHCRQGMSRLYDEVDAVLTKPGGVTISESLCKRKPIFIYDALPGQEQINQQQLLDFGIVFPLKKEKICEEIISTLTNWKQMNTYYENVEKFHSYKDHKEPLHLIREIIERAAEG